jgi:hypothetical protein
VSIEPEEVEEEGSKALLVLCAATTQLWNVISKFTAGSILLEQLQIVPRVEGG